MIKNIYFNINASLKILHLQNADDSSNYLKLFSVKNVFTQGMILRMLPGPF